MPNTFFTADTHFGCERLVKNIRQEFASIDEHDEALLDNINSTVGRNDCLVIIGDFCFKKPGSYRPKIKCKHIFYILGNHDQPAKIQAVFGGNVWQYRMMKLKHMVWCCHYPCCHWPQSHYGAFHGYGHTHNNTRYEDAMDLGMPGRRSIDVGVDSAKSLLGEYRPFSEDEFYGFLGDRIGHDYIDPKERWNQ